jgi:hypothetical protein
MTNRWKDMLDGIKQKLDTGDGVEKFVGELSAEDMEKKLSESRLKAMEAINRSQDFIVVALSNDPSKKSTAAGVFTSVGGTYQVMMRTCELMARLVEEIEQAKGD